MAICERSLAGRMDRQEHPSISKELGISLEALYNKIHQLQQS